MSNTLTSVTELRTGHQLGASTVLCVKPHADEQFVIVHVAHHTNPNTRTLTLRKDAFVRVG
jgi:hypothetical protein